MRLTRRASLLPLLVLWLLHFPLSEVVRGATRHVLVLSSSERPHAPQSGFVDALMRELIRSSREPIQFVEVSLQAARASKEAPNLSTAQRIRSAFGRSSPDLVITVGGPAATFAQQFRQELFPDAPVLIAGVDRRFVDNATFAENETTVATQHDPALVVDEILRLLPETRSIMVVIGASQVEQFWLQEMKREFRRFGERVQFRWTNDLSFAEIVERSRTMPARSAIFFAVLSLDGKGEPRVEGDTLKALHDVANAPLFALYGIGRGIVGGPLLSTEELSRTTAQVALRVFAGESPDSIQTPVQRSGRATYDARELRRWNIDESRLPPGSVVLFRQPTAWERNRLALALGVALGAMPVVAIVLLVGVVRRRRAVSRSAPVEGALVTPPAEAKVSIWTAGADGERVQAGRVPGAPPQGSWTDFVHPDDVERCRAIYRRALERREPFQMEYRILDGGVERWILDTGLVRYSGKVFDGYLGSAVDITAVGRARAELSHLTRHLIQAHERERATLAKTLHDDVCQRMVALTLRLHSLQGAAHDAEVAEIREQLTTLIAQIAAVPDPVHHRLELLGLTTAGRRFCEGLAGQYGVTIHFHGDDVPGDLPSDIALALFRVLQEATLNAVVRSRAREVWVSVRCSAAEVRLEIVDRGDGFNPQHAVLGDGVELVAIRERMKLVNGDSLIVSAAGEGTRVEAWVPLQRDATDGEN